MGGIPMEALSDASWLPHSQRHMRDHAPGLADEANVTACCCPCMGKRGWVGYFGSFLTIRRVLTANGHTLYALYRRGYRRHTIQRLVPLALAGASRRAMPGLRGCGAYACLLQGSRYRFKVIAVLTHFVGSAPGV